MPTFSLPELSPGVRRVLLGLSVPLTAAVVFFPIDLHYEYHALESLYAFGNLLPVFVIIFYIWMAVLVLLLFSKGENGAWQKPALLALFAIGMGGLWIVNTPYGGHPDELWQMGHIRYLLETGRIEFPHPVFNYFEFPAFHLLLASISRVTGLGIFEARLFYMFASSAIFAVLSYMLFVRLLKDARIASLGVLVLFLGCPMICSAERTFWPGNLAQLLLVALLFLLAWRQEKIHWVLFTILFVVFFTGLTMSYLPTAMFFIFVLLAIYLVQRINKSRLMPFALVMLILATFVIWQVSHADSTFRGAIEGLITPAATEPAPAAVTETPPVPATEPAPAAVTETPPVPATEPAPATVTEASPTTAAAPKGKFSVFLELGAVYIGAGAPLWVSFLNLFWLALIFGAGGILSIRNLFRIRKLDTMETIETGGIWAVVIFTPIAYLMSPVGEQTGRFFLYAPFFIVPMVLRCLARPAGDAGPERKTREWSGWLRKNSFTLLIILAFFLSLPSFLANATRVLSHPVYPEENAAGEFLRDEYADDQLYLYSTPFTITFYSYYVPEAHFKALWPGPDVTRGKEGFWEAMEPLMKDFEDSTAENAVFVVSRRLPYSYGPTIIIEPDDPKWIEFLARLEQNDKIYDNGFVQLYKHRTEPGVD